MGGGAVVGVEVLRGALTGDGSGSGDGSGYGDGYGDGSGYGYGYGDGYGYGYGYGSGDGYGYGYGDGSGYGYGSGSGDGEYWRAIMPSCLKDWTDVQVKRFHELVASKAHLAFWRSDNHGQPANSGAALPDAAAPGVRHLVTGPLSLCHAGTLHATHIPPKWQGERVWVVALHGEVVGDDEKFGCLEREIIGELVLGSPS